MVLLWDDKNLNHFQSRKVDRKDKECVKEANMYYSIESGILKCVELQRYFDIRGYYNIYFLMFSGDSMNRYTDKVCVLWFTFGVIGMLTLFSFLKPISFIHLACSILSFVLSRIVFL